MVKHKFDEEAFMNKTMHNMIAERDNLMEGIYDYKPTANVGTDPMESAARVDGGS